VFKTLFAWLGALGMTVLAARLIVSAVEAPTDGEAAIANFGAFASCGCGLVLFVLGLALRPTANTRVDTNTRQHAFTNRLPTADAGSGMVVDFTSGQKGGEAANNLSAALAEHYGTFGMGYEARVVGEERTSSGEERTVVDLGSYFVAPSTTIRVETGSDDDEEDAPDVKD
jgi:hypothetical protein